MIKLNQDHKDLFTSLVKTILNSGSLSFYDHEITMSSDEAHSLIDQLLVNLNPEDSIALLKYPLKLIEQREEKLNSEEFKTMYKAHEITNSKKYLDIVKNLIYPIYYKIITENFLDEYKDTLIKDVILTVANNDCFVDFRGMNKQHFTHIKGEMTNALVVLVEYNTMDYCTALKAVNESTQTSVSYEAMMDHMNKIEALLAKQDAEAGSAAGAGADTEVTVVGDAENHEGEM